jgi:large subunit ribosomal protein L6
MSRIGKVPLIVPKNVKVNVSGATVQMEGPKGKLSLSIPHGTRVLQKEDRLVVERLAENKQNRENHGTVRALLKNMINGVTTGHKKELEIQGIGFRAQIQGNKMILNLGFSHPIEFIVPKEVKVSVPKPTTIEVEGADRMIVGQIAAKLRDLKRPEPYKGKGIRYLGEYVRIKQGKSVTK